MKRMKLLTGVMLFGALCVGTADAQDSVAVTAAEMSIPFGVTEGHLIAVADQFLFVDRNHPEQSFALRHANIIHSSSENDVLSIRTDALVRNATEFTFRVDSDDAADILSWLGTSGVPSVASDTRSSEDTFTDTSGSTLGVTNLIGEYRVAHNHFLGECEGTLRITDDGIEFQSITEASHSKRWDMSDIKEIELENRDDLRVAPMIGGEYDFDFVSERLISDSEFRRLSDRVAQARLHSDR